MALANHIGTLLFAIVILPVAASGGEPQKVQVKAKRDPSEIVIKGVRDPSAWFRIESQHVIVYSNHDPDQVIELVDNLERLDYLLRLYMKPFLVEPAAMRKFTVYFQDRLNWPPEYGHADKAVGVLDSCVSATQAFTFDTGRMWKLDKASLLHAEDDFTLMNHFTLYAENFLYRQTRIRRPHWFIDGFVAYFGGVRFTDTQMVIGRDGGTSYNLLQEIDQGRAWRHSFDAVLRRGAASAPARFNSPEYYDRWEFLGRAFNLVHYVLSSEENRGRLAQYLERVDGGGDPAGAFDDIYGLSGRGLDAAMWRYRRTGMKIHQIDDPGLPKAHIDFTRLSRIEGDFVIDNALLKSCAGAVDGGKLLARLQETAAAAPAVDFAQVTLSRARIEWGNPREAIPYLADAVQRDPYNPEIHYLLGLAHLRLAERADDRRELLAAARASLQEAATLAPEAPEARYALFRAELMGAEAPSEKGVALAIDAWRHGRDVPAFARAAALAQAWLGDAAGAYQAFHTLAMNQRDPENAAWAATWLADLEKGVPRVALLAAMRGEKPALRERGAWRTDYR